MPPWPAGLRSGYRSLSLLDDRRLDAGVAIRAQGSKLCRNCCIGGYSRRNGVTQGVSAVRGFMHDSRSDRVHAAQRARWGVFSPELFKLLSSALSPLRAGVRSLEPERTDSITVPQKGDPKRGIRPRSHLNVTFKSPLSRLKATYFSDAHCLIPIRGDSDSAFVMRGRALRGASGATGPSSH